MADKTTQYKNMASRRLMRPNSANKPTEMTMAIASVPVVPEEAIHSCSTVLAISANSSRTGVFTVISSSVGLWARLGLQASKLASIMPDSRFSRILPAISSTLPSESGERNLFHSGLTINAMKEGSAMRIPMGEFQDFSDGEC